MLGEAGANYKQAICYTKETFAFAMASLVKPADNRPYAQKELNGVKMRVVLSYDEDGDANKYRIDGFSGYCTPRPEWGYRLLLKVS